MGLARQALDSYLVKLNTYPLRMQLMTGTMIGYAGDAIAQVGFQIDKTKLRYKPIRHFYIDSQMYSSL